MTREQAINYLFSCGFTHEQVGEVVRALTYEPTTKNNLGVDAVSRKAVHDMLENLPVTVENKWFNWLQKACMRLAELPSVTPQPRKGHWIADADRWGDVVTTVNGYRCDKCNAFNSVKDNYCPNCGAKMESEA